jgi:pyridoxal 5'-phosphate synthase pdxS subunit
MLKGNADVVTPEHARSPRMLGRSSHGARRVPADIRVQGVLPHERPRLILQIMDSVTIPVMAKVRIGHFVEAQILARGRDYIDGPKS